jgi:hypothetical protein
MLKPLENELIYTPKEENVETKYVVSKPGQKLKFYIYV